MGKKSRLIGPEVVVTVAGVAEEEAVDSVGAEEVVEVSEETVMVDTEEVEAVEVVASVVDAEAGSVETVVVDEEVVVEAVVVVTTAIKMVTSPGNALNNAKNVTKY